MKTKTESKHTPTPWVTFLEGKRRIIFCEQKDTTIAVLPEWDKHYEEEAKNNAEFIVRAVNSHGALLKALKTIANRGGLDLDYATIGNVARQAIADAEGK